MKVNGYEIGKEPTSEEFATYRKVREFILRETAAQFLENQDGLEPFEFEELCNRFYGADFGDEEWVYLEGEHDEIIRERNADD